MKRVYAHKRNNNILFRYGKIPESQFPSHDRVYDDRISHLNHMRSLIVLSTKGNNLPFSQERRCHGYVKMTVSERWVYKPLRVHLSRGRETSAPRNVPFISPGFLSSLLSRMNGLWSGDSVDWLYRGCWKWCTSPFLLHICIQLLRLQ